MKYILSLYFLLAAGWMKAQRVVIPMNENWQFSTDKVMVDGNINQSASWKTVSLPHTWNTDDVMDDTPGYYRGEAWYSKTFLLDKNLKGKEIYLCFEGANQTATIFINGKKAGEHTGGYTAFKIPLSFALDWSKENELLVKVDNSYNPNIPPLSADFTFYGGLYREVSLIAVDPVHFSLDDYGSKSIFISTPHVSDKKAIINIKGDISSTRIAGEKIKIHSVLRNKDGKKITESTKAVSLSSGGKIKFEQILPAVKDPHLWSPEDPYLYELITTIIDNGSGRVLDMVNNKLGLRFFNFDPANGFFLNGKSVKLVGASRHQDYKGMGNAVPASLARKDVELIREMGGNFLRVAHYPQDPSVLDACDELGIIASVEIPIVNEITESESFYNNSEAMQVEMIRQNYNHPSVIMWCYMNEVLLRPHYKDDKEKQKIYFNNITRLAKRLDSVTRKEDPYRYTMMAHHGDFRKYKDVGLIDIPMLVGWNLYSGWYGSNLADFPAFLDQFHKDYPNKPMAVTEYGADADPRIRSNEPVRFDKSVEYATIFHQFYLKEMMKRPFVAAAMIWNLADFNSETRVESMPHINNKGLLEWDRKPKDGYYFYKAMLTKKPFIKILGSPIRGGMADSLNLYFHQTVQVASNVEEVNLFVNGKSLGIKRTDDGIGEWTVPLVNGSNLIEVSTKKDGKLYSDRTTIECKVQPSDLSKSDTFRQLNILLGAKRYFVGDNEELWIPDQEYREGSWGYVGGQAFKIGNGARLPYGTDKDIRGTDDDPVYQTQQIGIEKYKLDVPPGEYELTLYFSELLGSPAKELAYNLDPTDRIEPSGQRIFDVTVNNRLLLESFNLTEQYGAASAVARTVRVSVKESKGIEIIFRPIEGEPILNALQLKKIYIAKQDESNVLK